MKKVGLFLLSLVVLFAMFAPLVLAQTDPPPAAGVQTSANVADQVFDTKTLIWMSATSIAQFVVSLIIMKIPEDKLPNKTIAYLTAIVGIVGFKFLLGLPFKEAVILAMATAYASATVAQHVNIETPKTSGGG